MIEKEKGRKISNNKSIGANLERKIHQSIVNNKGAKINTGGMGIRGRKRNKETSKRCLGNGKWFYNDRGRRDTKSKEQKLD